jgi:hypothetical protein
LDIDLGARDLNPTRMRDPLLDRLRVGNPAARSLPLLAALARAQSQTIILDYVAGNRITASLEPIGASLVPGDDQRPAAAPDGAQAHDAA